MNANRTLTVRLRNLLPGSSFGRAANDFSRLTFFFRCVSCDQTSKCLVAGTIRYSLFFRDGVCQRPIASVTAITKKGTKKLSDKKMLETDTEGGRLFFCPSMFLSSHSLSS